jgi:hypothetical protein
MILAYFGLATAQRGDLPAASVSTARGHQAMDQYRRWIDSQSGEFTYDWQDWLMCEIVQPRGT